MLPLLVTIADLLQPRTDNGVLAQVVVLAVVTVPAAWKVRRNRDILTFVIGVAVFLFAMIAFRILH